MLDHWHKKLMEDHRKKGRKDADNGNYDPPYIRLESGEWFDKTDKEANQAYKHGFMVRRAELGDKFKWA